MILMSTNLSWNNKDDHDDNKDSRHLLRPHDMSLHLYYLTQFFQQLCNMFALVFSALQKRELQLQ